MITEGHDLIPSNFVPQNESLMFTFQKHKRKKNANGNVNEHENYCYIQSFQIYYFQVIMLKECAQIGIQ